MAEQAKEKLEWESDQLTVSEQFLTLAEEVYRGEFDRQFDEIMEADKIKRSKICKWLGLSVEDARDLLYNEFCFSILNNVIKANFAKEDSNGVFDLIGRWFEKAIVGLKASLLEKLTKNESITELVRVMTVFAEQRLGTARTEADLRMLKEHSKQGNEAEWWAMSDQAAVTPGTPAGWWSTDSRKSEEGRWTQGAVHHDVVTPIAASAVSSRSPKETSESAAILLQGKKTIQFEEIKRKADPYDQRGEMTYCSQTAQDNARSIFGVILPGWDGTAAATQEVTAWGKIQASAKSGESVDKYLQTVERKRKNADYFRVPPPGAVIADIFATSKRAEWHRALAFLAIDPTTGKSERYILDPYRNKKSREPIPLSTYNGTITRADFYSATTIVVKKPFRKI